MRKTNRLQPLSEVKVAELVSENSNILLMLEHFGIGPAFHEKNLEQISREFNINLHLLTAFAGIFITGQLSGTEKIGMSDIPSIISYLQSGHSYYLDEKLPVIRQLIHDMAALNDHPEISLAGKFFHEYELEVRDHLMYENDVVFPYISRLYATLNETAGKPELPSFSVSEYEEHHDDIEIKLSDLTNLLIKYLPVSGDRQIRRNLIINLFMLGNELRIHTLIEDKILIPVAEKLEIQLKVIR